MLVAMVAWITPVSDASRLTSSPVRVWSKNPISCGGSGKNERGQQWARAWRDTRVKREANTGKESEADMSRVPAPRSLGRPCMKKRTAVKRGLVVVRTCHHHSITPEQANAGNQCRNRPSSHATDQPTPLPPRQVDEPLPQARQHAVGGEAEEEGAHHHKDARHGNRAHEPQHNLAELPFLVLQLRV